MNSTIDGNAASFVGSSIGSFGYALLLCEARADVQLVLGVVQAFIWLCFIPYFAKHIVKPYISGSKFKNQWIDLHEITYRSAGIELTREATFDMSCWAVPMITQHGLGGLLTLPYLFNVFSPEINAALGCHGALTEFGFELQDLVLRLWQRKFGTPAEKASNTNTVLKLIIAHHMVGLTLILPLNIYFRHCYMYHESNALLQGASFFALFAQQYGFTLDMSQEAGARTMRNISRITFAIMLYSRLLRYVPLQYNFNMYVREQPGFGAMANFAAVVSLGLSFFNVVILGSSWKKVGKFSDIDKVMASATKRNLELHNSVAAESESEPLAAQVGGSTGKKTN